jgi:hypothetical protein
VSTRKQTSTVYACDRCGGEETRSGAEGAPAEWRHLIVSRLGEYECGAIAFDLCNGCVEEFTCWKENGR